MITYLSVENAGMDRTQCTERNKSRDAVSQIKWTFRYDGIGVGVANLNLISLSLIITSSILFIRSSEDSSTSDSSPLPLPQSPSDDGEDDRNVSDVFKLFVTFAMAWEIKVLSLAASTELVSILLVVDEAALLGCGMWRLV